MIWDFIQDEVLGMKWLNRVIGSLLSLTGLDTESRIGGSIQFFLYDTIKIMVLLGVLILLSVSSPVKERSEPINRFSHFIPSTSS